MKTGKCLRGIIALLCILSLLPITGVLADTQLIEVSSARIGDVELSDSVDTAPEIEFEVAQTTPISVSGKLAYPGDEASIVSTSVDGSTSIVALEQVVSDSSTGAFQFQVVPSASIAASTTYVVQIGADGVSEPVRKYFRTLAPGEKPKKVIQISSPADSITQEGGSVQLTADIVHGEDTDSIVWSILEGDAATVSADGLVTAVKDSGSVTVKATLSSDETIYAVKTIIVSVAPTKTVSLTVNVLGGTVTNINEDGVSEYWGSRKTQQFEMGTRFRLTANPNTADSTFMYWQDADTRSKRIVSTDPTYEFILGTDTNLQAVYLTNLENPETTRSPYVIFRDRNGRVFPEGYTSAPITIPNTPTMTGYTFRYWLDGTTICDFEPGSILDVTDITTDKVYRAAYVKDPTEYNITINKADIPTGTYAYNTQITLHPQEPEAGMKFAWWIKDGNIVSYEEEYTFYVAAHDSTIEAHYVSEDTPVAKQPVIVMDDVRRFDETRLSFLSERSLPAEYELSETGILLSATTPDITLDTDGIIKSVSVSKDNNGQYTVRKANAGTYTWYARAYMIYKDGDNTVVVYSNVVSGKL